MKNKLTILLEKVSAATATDQELDELLDILRLDESNITGSQIHAFYKLTPIKQEPYSTNEMDEMFAAICKADHFANRKEKVLPARRIEIFKTSWARYAAILIMIVSAIAYQLIQHKKKQQRFSHATPIKDVLPGKQGAILTLADGSSIVLDSLQNGLVTKQNGTAVSLSNGALAYSKNDTSSSAQPLYNTIATPNGRQFQLTLPDGSLVWLNATSDLKFPVTFDKRERRVLLHGEAYFEIAKATTIENMHGAAVEKRMPFIVQTDKQEIEVLGTHFNVNAYTNETYTKTTLLEGAVKISLPNNNTTPVMLLPNEEAVVGSGGKVDVKQVDAEQSVAWKNGLFIFNDQSLDEIMRNIERWYNVQIEFKDDEKKKIAFAGSVSRFDKLSDLLKVLEAAGTARFTIEGHRVIVR